MQLKRFALAILIWNSSTVYCISQENTLQTTPAIYRQFIQDKNKAMLPDFSFAGYHYGERGLPGKPAKEINVTRFGILPGAGIDQTAAVQRLLDSVGRSGGGCLFFPKGRYLFNMDTARPSFIKINYSNIVIRGEGKGKEGTVFFKGNTLVQEKISPWLSPFLIQTGYALQGTAGFWGIDFPQKEVQQDGRPRDYYAATLLATVTAGAHKGDSDIRLSSATGIKAGDYILIGMYNTSADGNLIKELIQPYKRFETYELAATNAGRTQVPSFQWLVQVKRVTGNTIRLQQPLRRDLPLLYKPVVAAAPMLTEIGIEHIRFESAWDGYYCHHGCEKGNTRQAEIMDYGWNAINFCRVANGWIRDVAIDSYTNPIYLVDSRNVTVTGIEMSGFDGHSGVKIYGHASDNLITGLQYYCNYTHILSGEGNASGNVFSKIIYHPFDRKPGDFDFHGFADDRFAPPSENLFENITGMHQISGGGGPSRLPHTGNYNTWWNVEEAGFTASKEVFHSWLWSKGSAHYKEGKDHHKLYPRSIIVGMYSLSAQLEINGNNTDTTNDEWVYVEHFNRGKVFPLSLYEAQFKDRMAGSASSGSKKQ